MPLSVLLNIAWVKKRRTGLVWKAGTPESSPTRCHWQRQWTTIVAYGQNGEPLRNEQGYPIRLVLPGWQGPRV